MVRQKNIAMRRSSSGPRRHGRFDRQVRRDRAQERIYALNVWRESPLFSDEERAALGLTEGVTLLSETLLSETRVPDEVWAEAAFGATALAKVLMAAVEIIAWNRIAVATRMGAKHAR